MFMIVRTLSIRRTGPAWRRPGMVERREQEADPGLVQRLAGLLGAHVQLRPELLEHVGRAAARGDRAVAVLGDRQAGRGRGEGDRGRDVDRGGAVAAGAAAVGEEIIGPREIGVGGSKGPGGAGQLLGRLALEPKRDEHRGDGRLGQSPGDELGEQRLGFGFGEGFAGVEPGERGLGGRWLRTSARTYFGWVDMAIFLENGAQKKRPAGSGGPSGDFGLFLEGPVHHRWSSAAAEEMSHHQCQACAAAGAERAQEEPVRVARVVIAGSIPS